MGWKCPESEAPSNGKGRLDSSENYTGDQNIIFAFCNYPAHLFWLAGWLATVAAPGTIARWGQQNSGFPSKSRIIIKVETPSDCNHHDSKRGSEPTKLTAWCIIRSTAAVAAVINPGQEKFSTWVGGVQQLSHYSSLQEGQLCNYCYISWTRKSLSYEENSRCDMSERLWHPPRHSGREASFSAKVDSRIQCYPISQKRSSFVPPAHEWWL